MMPAGILDGMARYGQDMLRVSSGMEQAPLTGEGGDGG
jgi:hypothetical protein